MSSRSPTQYPRSQARRREPKPVPSMATPRRPQPPKKLGFLGSLFLLALLGGMIWLFMLILGLGPYTDNETKPTLIPTSLAILPAKQEITVVPTITQTSAATGTFAPSHTPTATPSPTLETFPFILIGEPEAISSDLLRPSLGCDYLVIAGQVWDLQDRAVKGLRLHLSGELTGYLIEQVAVTGAASVYGESGYEFLLENLVVNSRGALLIQLVDDDDVPYSLAYPLQTFQDCQKNLILVNFKQVR